MTSPMRPALRALLPLACSLSTLVACSDDPVGVDAGAQTDAAPSIFDSGLLDIGVGDTAPAVDSGPADAGFSDPAIIRAERAPIPADSTVHPGTITTINTYFEIHRTGTSTLPPLFVAPRGPGTNSEYLPRHLEFLTRNRTVIYYDIRGTGRSSYGDGTMNSTVTVAQHASDLAGLIDYVGQLPDGIDTTRIDILAHGYGALLAIRYASAHPARVAHLALVNPYPATIDEYVEMRGELESRMGAVDRQRVFELVNRPECFGSDSQCYAQVWAITGKYTMCLENREKFALLTFTGGSFRNEFFFIQQDLRGRSYDDRPLLPAIRATTSVITGPCEPAPPETAQSYGAIAGAEQQVLPLTGEFPMVEDPAAFQNAVLHALGR